MPRKNKYLLWSYCVLCKLIIALQSGPANWRAHLVIKATTSLCSQRGNQRKLYALAVRYSGNKVYVNNTQADVTVQAVFRLAFLQILYTDWRAKYVWNVWHTNSNCMMPNGLDCSCAVLYSNCRACSSIRPTAPSRCCPVGSCLVNVRLVTQSLNWALI